VHRANFVVLDRGIYFTPQRRGANGESAVQYLDFATGAIKTICPIDKTIDLELTGRIRCARSLAGSWINVQPRGQSSFDMQDNAHLL
jgi:hypothetical protein